MLDPANSDYLLGTKCGVECLNGYYEEPPSPPRECEKDVDGVAYWKGEETNCTGKHLVDMVEFIILFTSTINNYLQLEILHFIPSEGKLSIDSSESTSI